MGKFRSLSTMGQVALGGSVLYLIVSFLPWQDVAGLGTWNEWHGWGVIAGLVSIALVAYESSMLGGVKISIGSLPSARVSGILALLLLVMTFIKFIDDNEARAWAAWIGLILSIVIAAASWMRMKEQGVSMSRPSS